MYDIIIIGAGIVGTILARDLSRYQLKVAVIDKENDIANGTTMANSAIVHTGYDPQDGTLKAKLNVRGANLYEQLCKDIDTTYKTVGAFVCACGEEEEKHLDLLADRAKTRNVKYEWLNGDEARVLEPHLSPNVTKVLNFYTTAIIYPWLVSIGCMEVAVKNGSDLFLNEKVTSIEEKIDGFIVRTTKNTYSTKIVINASGVYTSEICRMVCDDPGFTITPKKGEYFVLEEKTEYVKHIIFPVPSSKGKGVLAVPTVNGNILFGPSAEYLEDKDDVSTTKEGLKYVRKNLTKILVDPPLNKTIRTFAGLRASSTSKDFIIEESKVKNFINVASIESPGIASAPAISEYIIETILKKKLPFVINEDAVMTRKAPVVMKDLSVEERNTYIAENPLYGRIICRCEKISEGEIVDAIRSVCGARSIKGVKKRVFAGFGKCQGGFCEPRVLDILAREMNCKPTDIVLDAEDSYILLKENR